MRHAHLRLLLAAAAIAGLAAITSCSTSPRSVTAPATPDPSELRAGPIENLPDDPDPVAAPTASLSVSQVIDGRVGGVLTTGRWKVVVPRGAFNGIGTITLFVSDPTVDRCDLTITPSSLNHFAKPVDLRFLCATLNEADNRTMKWWNPQQQKWVHIESWVNESDVSRCAPLGHFSTYSSGKAGW